MVGGGLKIYGKASGKSGIQGRGKATAKEIGELFRKRFEQQDWIE